ncbi:MAG TPA: hypothetical protein VHK03_04470 [Aestuariivirgaceae bacterium]|jgi:hypothetical protein|nr:hypothetical protein [Aestuariivirgaceae bacterium]
MMRILLEESFPRRPFGGNYFGNISRPWKNALVGSFIGKKLSMRISATVMSCGLAITCEVIGAADWSSRTALTSAVSLRQRLGREDDVCGA